MKTMNILFRYVAIAIIGLAIIVTACKRKSKDEVVVVADPAPDLTSERDFSNADNDLNSLLRDIDKIDDNNSSSLRTEAVGYFTVFRKDSTKRIDGVTYNKYVELIYTGTADDGQSRSGLITIFSTGSRVTGDFEAYASFEKIKVGGRSISGTKKIIQQVSGDVNKWQFFITAIGTATTIEGKTITYNSNRTRVRSGISTLEDFNDSFSITGSWTGINGNGENIVVNITSPLQLSYGCRFFREITSGKIAFVNNSKGITRSVDYGSGGCDGKGTFVNAKGRVFEFYFKR